MKTYELVNDKNKCCGCGLCAAKCPKNAIEMQEDEYGFIFPYINKDKCINCGLCKKICTYNKTIENNNFEKITYASCSNKEEILNTTASGGIFTSIATDFINQDGIVFGCSLEKENNKFKVKHIKVDNLKDLEKLKGSKYIQSDIKDIYKEIKEYLKENKKVLFSGTPCQVAAIKTFTNNPDNLYTIDIICHGVPNNKMFNDYINYLEQKNNISISNFTFRDKSKSWGLFAKINYIKNKEKLIKVIPCVKSSYYQLFLDSLIYRENCYTCPYANEKRISDITIGDYWGIESEHPEYIKDKYFNPEKGISCVVVNNNKGKELINTYSKKMSLFDSKFEKVKRHNHQLQSPSKYSNKRDELLKIYKENDYKLVDKWYRKYKGINYYIKSIWYKIPYSLRKIIKK